MSRKRDELDLDSPRATTREIFTPLFRRGLRLSRRPTKVAAAAFDYAAWLQEIFPHLFTKPFAEHHRDMWEWGKQITSTSAPKPDTLVAILPRGGGKTTNIDGLGVYLLGEGHRKCIGVLAKNYDTAEDRIKSMRGMIESPAFRSRYPKVAEPAISAAGSIVSWNADCLYTASGQVIRALSLDKIKRGFNFFGLRPDMLIIDDVDDTFDTEYLTTKKEQCITKELLPMFGNERPPVTIFIQNLIKFEGIADRLVKRRADWAHDRVVIGPIRAIEGLEVETEETEIVVDDEKFTKTRYVITGGTATWEGQDLEACQAKIDRCGFSAFLEENQHQVTNFDGALLKSAVFRYVSDFDVNKLRRCVVGVDPCGGGAEFGIIAVGMDPAGNFYVLEDQTLERGPGQATYAETAVKLAAQWRARVVVEANFGGKLLALKPIQDAATRLYSTREIDRQVVVKQVNAQLGKMERARPVAGYYTDGRVFHTRKFTKLEAQWTTWIPSRTSKSPDRLDALVHAINDLEQEFTAGAVVSLPSSSSMFLS